MGLVPSWQDTVTLQLVVMHQQSSCRCLACYSVAESLRTACMLASLCVARACCRDYAPCFQPTVLGASAQLKLQLCGLLTSHAEQQLAEAAEDSSCVRAAAQLHARAVSAGRNAAADAQRAGAVLLQAECLQAAAELLTDTKFSQGPGVRWQQRGTRQSDGRRQSGGGCGSPAPAASAALDAITLLQVQLQGLSCHTCKQLQTAPLLSTAEPLC